jgi:SagB-type dehydrogenase family enzyme
MKSGFADMDGRRSDQAGGVAHPPLEKPYEPSSKIFKLPKPDNQAVRKTDIHACLKNRRSRRNFSDQPLTLVELSLLLWATQGIDRVGPNQCSTFRPAPSAGARHPFETYVLANHVAGLTGGIYRYLPLTHELLTTAEMSDDIPQRLSAATFGQEFVARGAAVFFWSCIPYRGEWRYQQESHKNMLLDAGHVCQNLYLAAEAIEFGACAIAAYDQNAVDSLLGLDGDDEFVVYLAPVGKPV